MFFILNTMNIIFNFTFIACLGLFLFCNPAEAMQSILSASEKSVTLCISLISIYAVWLGILEIAEQSGLNKKVASLLSPIIKFLFGNQPEQVKEQIAINLSSNILGMGNASTPSGIKAMELMDNKSGEITKPMAMLMLINSMSIQLVPTTIIGLRIAYKSANPTCVILPIIICSLVSTCIGVFMIKLFYKNK